jgi:hypothetical protein
MRFVTIATALMLPRFDFTTTLSPLLIPFFFASPSEISMNSSGCSEALMGTFFDQ